MFVSWLQLFFLLRQSFYKFLLIKFSSYPHEGYTRGMLSLFSVNREIIPGFLLVSERTGASTGNCNHLSWKQAGSLVHLYMGVL